MPQAWVLVNYIKFFNDTAKGKILLGRVTIRVQKYSYV